jgi:hypothetical protein
LSSCLTLLKYFLTFSSLHILKTCYIDFGMVTTTQPDLPIYENFLQEFTFDA